MNKQTETLSKATPRPWNFTPARVINEGRGMKSFLGAEVTNTANDMVICQPNSKSAPFWEANAALIVRAVNEYEALCKVAEAANECERDWLPSSNASLERMRKALNNLEAIRKGTK